ncbi:unnamed protein product [Darwinula stevensoni]|uniref:tRNA (guanine(26)-N(2))-dimethyltransferase n=2 Tax=Darwinula stevensoni TaxID=69355 RepID=A0A7R9FNG2_9CRUS|nr:unnamed protein product [Darwinula stevensoni]CAG0896765.1 unnamed protein product [Darwinula stevensoni]
MDGSKHSKSANNLPGSKASVQENCVSVSGSESQKQLSSDMDVDVEYPGPSLKEHLMREESDSGSRLILDDVSSAVVQSDSAFSCSPDVVPMELDKENDLIELKSDDESGQTELKESHYSTEVVLSSECWETQESSNGKKRLKAAEMPKVTSRSEEKITCETDAIMTSNVSSVEMEQGDDVEVEVIKVAAEMDQRQAVISSLMEHLLGVVVRKSEMKVKTTFKNVAKPGTSVISGSTKKPRQQDSPKEPESQPGPSSRRTPRRAAKKAENNIRIYAQAEANQEAENEGSGMITQICAQCKKLKLCRYQVIMSDKRIHLCDESCFNTYKALHGFKTSGSAPIVKGSSKLKPVRKVSSTDENTPACLNGIPRSFHCAYCNANTQSQNFGLSWETMDFCSQNCLEKYQTHYGSHCAQCKTKVNAPCLGKYCVRFGSDIRQFCSNPCLESFKKNLKVCTYCQMDISNSSDSFLAPVGDKGVFKDFCSPKCMEKHEELNGARSKQTTGPPAKCAVCGQVKPAKVEVILSARNASLCSDPCFMAFKYANHLSVVRCKICSKYLEKESQKTMSTTYNRRTEYFCSKVCLSVFVLATRKIVPCASCKVKKYNFDMIERWSPTIRPIEYFCSLVCYEKLPLPKPTSAVATTNQALQSVPNSIQTLAVPASSSSGTQAPTPNVIRVRCEYCQKQAPISYQLMLRSGKTANFCSQGCASSFQKKAPGMTTTVMPIQSTATAVSPVPVVTQGILSSSAKLPIQSTAATVSTLPVVTSGMTSSAKLPIPVIQTVSSLAPSPNLSPNNTPTTKAQAMGRAHSASSPPLVCNIETRPLQDDIEIKTIDPDTRIILDAQINVLLDAKAEVARAVAYMRSGMDLVCPICGRRFLDPESMKMHHVSDHSVSDLADALTALQMMMRQNFKGTSPLPNSSTEVSESSHQHEYCKAADTRNFDISSGIQEDYEPEGFVYKSYLTEHKFYHQKERQFICETCGQSYSSDSCLRKHQKRHSKQKAHVCEFCGKGFVVRYDLTAHIKMVHQKLVRKARRKRAPTNEKPGEMADASSMNEAAAMILSDLESDLQSVQSTHGQMNEEVVVVPYSEYNPFEDQDKNVCDLVKDLPPNLIAQVQQSLSIHVAVLAVFNQHIYKKSPKDDCSHKKQETEQPNNKGLRILEALAASGLRSIRFAKEVEGIAEIIANDLSHSAVESITKNIKHNHVESLVTPSCKDATLLMYESRRKENRFDVIDLDPYGSPSQFLDGAVQSLADGGLLMITATDMAILCGNTPEKCFASYGAMPLKSKSCHEMALRIILHSLESHANRYGRYIHPLLSLSADFYCRIFVTVHTSQAQCKYSASKVGLVYQCSGCETLWSQRMAQVKRPGPTPVFANSPAIPNGPTCTHCNHKLIMGGPMWLEAIHDKVFVAELLQFINEGEKRHFGTERRMDGVLSMILEELDTPFYYLIDRLSSVVRTQPPPLLKFRSALMNAGFEVSLSHACKNSIKTNAPETFLWDVMRTWEKKYPCKRENLDTRSPAMVILSKEPEAKVDFTVRKDANPASREQGLLRFQKNPLPNWGPKSRAQMS